MADWLNTLVDAPLAVFVLAVAFSLLYTDYKVCRNKLDTCWRRVEACQRQRAQNGLTHARDADRKD